LRSQISPTGSDQKRANCFASNGNENALGFAFSTDNPALQMDELRKEIEALKFEFSFCKIINLILVKLNTQNRILATICRFSPIPATIRKLDRTGVFPEALQRSICHECSAARERLQSWKKKLTKREDTTDRLCLGSKIIYFLAILKIISLFSSGLFIVF